MLNRATKGTDRSFVFSALANSPTHINRADSRVCLRRSGSTRTHTFRLLYFFKMSSQPNQLKNNSCFNIENVLAMLCDMHHIDPVKLQTILYGQAKHKPNQLEIMMVEQISNQLVNGIIYSNEEEYLDFDDYGEIDNSPEYIDDLEDFYYEEKADSDWNTNDHNDPDYIPSPEKRPCIYVNQVEPEAWERAYRYWTKQMDYSKQAIISAEYYKKLSPQEKVKKSTVQKKFSFVDAELRNLRRWVQRTEEGIVTIRELNKLVFERFCEKRSKNGIVSDRIIRKWALEMKKEKFPKTKFKASSNWLYNFKRRYGIVSRSITHKVGKNFVKNQQILEETRVKFLEEVKQKIKEEEYSPDQVLNIDQSRFDKLLQGHRTLEIQGAKKVFSSCGSVSATTHSYMVMPIICMAGTLMKMLYLKAQEPNGKFPTTHVPAIPSNIKAYPGTTAMMTKNDLQIFLEEIFFPCLRNTKFNKFLLLADSWSSNKDDELFAKVSEKFPDITVERMLIPAGTTGIIQPLDVYYFRPYKRFIRYITDCLELDDKVWQRKNYFKLQALAHFQFSAPKFTNMLKYSFYKAGYLSTRPDKFISPLEFCFDFDCVENCTFLNCNNLSEFRCAHCEGTFCFIHTFLKNLHINCNQ